MCNLKLTTQRPNRSPNTSASKGPMRSDNVITSAYRGFLQLCIDTLDPKLIITLGIAPAWFVRPLVGNSWHSGLRPSAKLRMADLGTEPVQISSGLVFVAATHPSHPQNRKYRRFSVEDVDEVGLIARARRIAGIPDHYGRQSMRPSP